MSRKDRAKIKITTKNFTELYPTTKMTFPGVMGVNTVEKTPPRNMRTPKGFAQVRYVYFTDIIDVMERRIEKQGHRPNMRKHKKVWKEMIILTERLQKEEFAGELKCYIN